MTVQIPDWPRQYYRGPGGKPFVWFAVSGKFEPFPALDSAKYQCAGIPKGLTVSRHDAEQHGDYLKGLQEGPIWDALKQRDPALAQLIGEAPQLITLAQVRAWRKSRARRRSPDLAAALTVRSPRCFRRPSVSPMWLESTSDLL